MQSKQIPINKILQNLLNPNQMGEEAYQKLRMNMQETGNYPSLIVTPKNNQYLLLDGWHRLKAATELDWDKVWCEVWELNGRRADLMLATLNRLRGTDDLKKRALLIAKLNEEFKNERELLLRLIPEKSQSLDLMVKFASERSNEVLAQLRKFEGNTEERLKEIVKEENEKRQKKRKEFLNDKQLRLIFYFDDESDYEIATSYFDKFNPDTQKLIALISDDSVGKLDDA